MKIKLYKPYAELRAAAYPPVGDQLDALIKAMQAIRETGIDLGKDFDQLATTIAEIKARYPKAE